MFFFSDLSIVENDSYYIIGRTKLEEVESDISKEYEEVDLKDFIINLTQLNFIERIDDIYIESNQKYRNKGITFKNIRQESLKWIFTKGFIFSIAIVIFLGFYSLYHISIKNGFPNYKDVFFTSNLLIVIIAVYIIDILLCMTHEFAHFISIRGLSGNMGYISIGRRLIYLVFQTNMENIWSMSKEQRIVICFSGILSDIILISIFSIFARILINLGLFTNIFSLLLLLTQIVITCIIFIKEKRQNRLNTK
ncbi:hypothetical protein [Tissierella pigra]|uniref:Uncharacterized protein n=1 Tax=Tissierella pigra TaxID=2607614 RepID=A0A6N7XMV7_9FIRM|nr:hypothetical protein [Tissierella pigra]MSU02846.1 hypothetical protein [Tissierella pigra]